MPVGTTLTADNNVTMTGIEFGTIWLQSPIIFRLVGHLGIARITTKTTGGSTSTKVTETEFLHGPGVLLAVPIKRSLIGVEVRYLQLTGQPDSFAIYGTIGASFGGQ